MISLTLKFIMVMEIHTVGKFIVFCILVGICSTNKNFDCDENNFRSHDNKTVNYFKCSKEEEAKWFKNCSKPIILNGRASFKRTRPSDGGIKLAFFCNEGFHMVLPFADVYAMSTVKLF